ncbi:MAG: AAA family ATPase, partial [Anaerolineales bacterium]
MKPLPVGTPTFFKDMIEGGYLYIDKTRYIYELVRYPKGVYFLSRPRRFGKTLLISTLAEIFAGHRELFEGLWIDESDYEWEAHPVVRIDLSQLKVTTAEKLKHGLKRLLGRIAKLHSVQIEEGTYYEQFYDLIFELAHRSGKGVVVLVDEYDKPLIDNIGDVDEARRIREVLKGFYTILKAQDEHLRFVFLTGVSKFSKVGVFSGLNNLDD